MAIRDVLEELENLVADAAHVPLSGKCMIDENDLVHLVEELRNTLPTALTQAENIMTERDAIIGKARSEAEQIIKNANEDAERRVSNSIIEREARDKARAIMDETEAKSRAMMEEASAKANAMINEATEKSRAMMDEATEKSAAMVEDARQHGEDIYKQVMQKKAEVDQYANQVFNQLITHVSETLGGVQQAEQGLSRARQVLETAQTQMNQAE